MMPLYRADALAQLCHALRPEDSTLAEEVALANGDPRAYYAQFGKRLRERGIESSRSVALAQLPWLALLDGLLARRCMEEFDWKALPELVIEGIDGLLAEQGAPALDWGWVDVASWYSVYTWDFLQAVGDRLLLQGRMLAQFYEDSDSYPVMIINPSQLAELQRLARLSGYGDIQPLASTLPQDFQLPWSSEN